MLDRPRCGDLTPWPTYADVDDHMEQHKAWRVVFERGYDAHMMAIDGTWRWSCIIEDVSDTGAKLSVEGSLSLKECFMRPCQQPIRGSVAGRFVVCEPTRFQSQFR